MELQPGLPYPLCNHVLKSDCAPSCVSAYQTHVSSYSRRVVLKSLGAPLLGDPRYAAATAKSEVRQPGATFDSIC
eukprot:6020445-Pleurochrysis_carterae.AAC.2